MFLSAKGAPPLEHQRGRSQTHSGGKYPWRRETDRQRVVFFLLFFFPAGDSSLVNVTLRDEVVANKHNGSFSLGDHETVTPRGKKKKKKMGGKKIH